MKTMNELALKAFEFTLAEIPPDCSAIVYLARRYEQERGSLPSADEARARFELVEGELRWKQEQPREAFATEQTWRSFMTKYGGKVAGRFLTTPSGCRYRQVGYQGRRFKAHQLVALITLGFLPSFVTYHGQPLQIDHINHDGLDNRLSNLRLATNGVNHRNKSRSPKNRTGLAGVRYDSRCPSKPWHARLYVNGEYVLSKFFPTLLGAAAAVLAARNKYGFHENHGKP